MIPASPSKYARLGLLGLFGLLVVVELGPLLVFYQADGLWLLNNAEDFDFLFWPPLKVAFAPSHFFFHVGCLSWAMMKPVHTLTALMVGSSQASLEYLQTFGYLARALYAGLMLAVPTWYWWRQRDAFLTGVIVAMALALHLATPFMFQMYHMRLGTQLTNKLLILVASGITFDALKVWLAGDRLTTTRILTAAGFAGMLFVEIPSYILFCIPLMLITLGQVRRPADAARCGALWAAGGLAGFSLCLFLFYGTDWPSIFSALVSMLKGLVAGYPQPQPGFNEQFLHHLFDSKSSYFWVHITLTIQAVLITLLLVVALATWRFCDRRAASAALGLVLTFALVWLAHTRIWATRGSYTSVFSLVYFGNFSVLLAVILLRQIKRQLPSRTWRAHACTAAATLGAVGFAAPCLVSIVVFDYRSKMVTLAGTAQSFRALNSVIEALPKPISLKLTGLPEAPFLVAGHYAMAGFYLHSGEWGWNGEDARYSAQIQAQRFPDYHIVWIQGVHDLWYDYKKWTPHLEIKEGWPGRPATTIISSITHPLTDAEVKSVEKNASLVAPALLPPDRSLAHYLLEDATRGIVWEGPKTFPWARWLIAPLGEGNAKQALLTTAWPENWNEEGLRFFFVKTYFGQYLLALPTDAAPSASRH